uniref:E2F transcription factor 5 n=1 Tax=Pundamilia nyererei TaxID=303518 RepID=A0A3B4FMC6_9CICH
MKTSAALLLEVPLPEMGQSGQKKYQVNLRSHSAPIQVVLINRDSDSRVPVVFSVPPTDDICQMPTPPNMLQMVQNSERLTPQWNRNMFLIFFVGAVDLIEELMSTDGKHHSTCIDYSFNLDDNEGVCDLFDVQILNY